jgi:phosphatidylinositol glycan class O
MTKIRVLIIILLLFFNILASLYIFSNGFLIRRTALNNTNNQAVNENLKKCSKVILLFIDALRFDFIFSDGNYFGLPIIENLLKNEPQNSQLYKFIADPPTTTMQRIKAMMSGTLPTFIDAGANFNSYLIDDDNIIRQFYTNNKSVIILGDDTWLSLFPNEHIAEHHVFPSFNIKDLDTNDIEVDRELQNLLDNKEHDHNNWAMVIGHYLGLDHCGHTFGPKNPNIKRKLTDIDKSIQYIANSIDNDTLLVVFGDHGMTDVGDHGGDSKLEVESALFFYSKQKLFDSNLDGKKIEEVRQIDLTPTLALALGIPIPFSNLGIPIMNFFKEGKLDALRTNLEQVIFCKIINKF